MDTNNNFFSGSAPDLISNKSAKQMQKLFDARVPKNDPFSSFVSNFYTNYIVDNIFVIMLFVIFCLFLLYKYLTKPTTEDFRPTFNPGIPVKEQQSFVNYLPDSIPSIMDGKVVTHNDINPPKPVTLEYPPLYNQPEQRLGYHNTVNTYKHAEDSKIPHPYRWADNMNSSTGEAVGFMTDHNRKSLNDLADIIFAKNDDLETKVNGGYPAHNSGNYGDIYYEDDMYREMENPMFNMAKPYSQ